VYSSAADRVFLDCRGALASPSVVPAARGASPGGGADRGSRRRGWTGARPGRPDAAGLEDRAPGWPGCRPGACGPLATRGREADATPDHRV